MATSTPYEFDKVRAKERERIIDHRKNKKLDDPDKKQVVGLAISGGGIRSASFGLGVLQAFDKSKFDQLKNVDYLSTVSGGGFIGSSLTWFTNRFKKDWTFPFGSRGRGARSGGDNRNVLAFIRQHGDYLKPGDGLSTASLAATALRNILLSFVVYFLLLVVLFLPFKSVFGDPCLCVNGVLKLSLGFAILLGILTGLYGLGTFIVGGRSMTDYWLRVYLQIVLGFVLAIGIFLAFVGTLPIVKYLLGDLAQTIGGLSAAGGGAGGVYEFLRQRRTEKPAASAFSALRLWITAFLLAYGLLLLAYTMAAYFWQNEDWPLLRTAGWILAPALIFGLFINTNYFGLGRMYRDRLMETFLPNPQAVESGQWQKATDADRAKLSEMCGADERGPYHLINCNIVLVDSEKAQYRARGGDSFLLSPLFCGSNATYWYDTRNFLNDNMTLPTAMAISGAAANPNTGVAGGGPTRNRLISFLMAFINLRLGYFAHNPHAKGIHRFLASATKPNLIYPGIVQGLLGQRLNAKAGYIELTDGGHFDNTGIYELARRRADVIIVSEAGADPNSTLADLANAVERVKVDFGYYIEFDRDDEGEDNKDYKVDKESKEEKFSLKNLLPGSSKVTFHDINIRLAKNGFAKGTIEYGKDDTGKEQTGTILFIKATLTDDLPADLYAYRKANVQFPNQSTVDQFFDEVQLEAYRELGYRLCKKLLTINQQKAWIIPLKKE